MKKNYIQLGDIIKWLEQQDPNLIVPIGFGKPMSYRGYYEDLAFKPVENARLGDMLEHARSALDQEFDGYKGGIYKMDEYTTCWISEYGDGGGDCIGYVMLKLWETCVRKPGKE